MSGIYGDMLLAFPEQMESVSVYQMTPRQGGGWTSVTGSTIEVTGIIQNTTGDTLKDASGNLVKAGGLEFWTATTDLDGYFMTYSDIVYRLTRSNDWMKQGGFTRYSMEKVGGNHGSGSDNTTWNLGGNSF